MYGARVGLRRAGWALALAIAVLSGLPIGSTAHTCAPDPQVGVSGRLLLPRASGLALIELPDRTTSSLPVLPVQGVVTSVARSLDGSRLAVARFSRPADQQIGNQDLLILGPAGGQPLQVIPASQPGEVLGSPAWLPDGSLVFQRQTAAGVIAGTRVERLSADGSSAYVVADQAFSPTASSDGARVAFIRAEESDRLVIADLATGIERVLVDNPSLTSLAFPRFSPDGAWIAFAAVGDPTAGMANRAPQPPSFKGRGSPAYTWFRSAVAHAHGVPWDIWVIRPDGSDLRRVTYFYDDDPSAAWSPDGQWLAVFSGEALHVVAVDGPANYCIAGEGGYGAIEWLP